MGEEPKDLYRRLELEVRAPARRLLLDAFLPDPASLPSAVAAPAPPPLPEMGPEEAHFLRPREPDDDEPPPPPKPKRKAKPAARKKESPMTLQEEIEEFMKRDRSAYAPDDDLDNEPGTDPPAGPGSGGKQPG
jgi:hypothetical protein